MYIYTGIFIIIFILIIGYLYYKNINRTDSFINYSVEPPIIKDKKNIPKIIWTYWNDLLNIPHIVTKCIDTWLLNNEDYDIYILDDEKFKYITKINVMEHFLITNNKSHQKKSDFIRLALIYMFGGIWMDASMICMESLNWVQKIYIDKKCEFIGYSAPNNNYDIVIDSWFLAAIPNSIFLYDWLNEFNNSLLYKNDEEYCNELIKKYPVPKDLITLLPYLTIHLCNWFIRYVNYNKYNLHIMSSIDVGAPLYYLEKNKFNSTKLCNDIKNNIIVPMKLFKITGPLRNNLIYQIKRYKTNNKFINYVFDNRY